MDLNQRCNSNSITQPVATALIWFNEPQGAIGSTDATEFVPLAAPVRVLDTREGIGLGRTSPLGPGETVEVAVAGCGGCPPAGTAKSVVMNVTATGGTTPGYLSVWPKGGAQPEVSNVNWLPFESRPNLAVVKVSADGKVNLYNPAGNTHAIFDVIGYFAPDGPGGSRFHPLKPWRIMDTRVTGDPLQPFVPRNLPIPVTGATGAVMNVTAAGLNDGGYLTVYPSDVNPPLASNLNYQPGEIVPNLVVAGVANGSVNLISGGAVVHVVVDLVGWFDTDESSGAGRFVPVDPARKLDTREGGLHPLGPGGVQDFGAAGQVSRYPFEVSAVVMNTTVANTTAPSYLTVYPTSPGGPPFASNLNWLPGQDRPNLVMVGMSDFGFVTAYNAAGSADLIYDVAGWFTG
jgi:hypothetical protein